MSALLSLILDGRTRRAVSRPSSVWGDYNAVERYNGAVRHDDGTARPVPSSVARFL